MVEQPYWNQNLASVPVPHLREWVGQAPTESYGQVQNEKKQIICNLIALGIDDVAIISKVVILNERTIRKYHRECQIKKGELSMHTMVRFLTALRLRTDQETLEEFAIHALRCLFDREDGELRRMLEEK